MAGQSRERVVGKGATKEPVVVVVVFLEEEEDV
jgi:hypothetical protein